MMILLEIVEFILALIGVIWIMLLITNLIKGAETNICTQEHFIGILDVRFTVNQLKNSAIFNLYMKELSNGKSIRQAILICDEKYKEWVKDKSRDGMEVKVWKKGGPFPVDFKPVEPLGEMLHRMMKAKFTGKEITISVETPDA